MKFYMGYSREVPDTIPQWAAENDVGLLSNATQRWSHAQDRFLDMWEYEADHVVDAGGYNVLGQWVRDRVDVGPQGVTEELAKEAAEADPDGLKRELSEPAPFYPWTVDEYHEWLSEFSHEFEWACVMDYACESKFDPIMPKQVRMDYTIQNTIRQFEKSPAYDLIPVLQGRSFADYIWSHTKLTNHDIPTEYVGLGTVCRISSESRIVELEQDLREHTDVEKIHGFGVKIDAYKMGSTFNTADSAAWVRAPSNCKKYVPTGNGSMKKVDCGDYRERSVESFQNYYHHVEAIANGGY